MTEGGRRKTEVGGQPSGARQTAEGQPEGCGAAAQITGGVCSPDSADHYSLRHLRSLAVVGTTKDGKPDYRLCRLARKATGHYSPEAAAHYSPKSHQPLIRNRHVGPPPPSRSASAVSVYGAMGTTRSTEKGR
jgi:hypothetical protein